MNNQNEYRELNELVIEITKDSKGNTTTKTTICDGEVHLGPFKSCLKEFSGISAIGWVSVAIGLIVLWKWLECKFKK
ncbi:hypothetical protein EB001_01120 [bacterium]|nr:hypothetical protein [bacterium]